MSGVVIAIVLTVGLLVPLPLWLAIVAETSDSTVVDRSEAERIVGERGGRFDSCGDERDRRDGSASDDAGWGTETDESDSWR